MASRYEELMLSLGVSISKPKSLISSIGALEFAKKFRIHERDLSPINVQMVFASVHSVAWMPVLKVFFLQTSLRLRSAGFRRYTATAQSINPNFNRHWYRHILVAYSPGGRLPLPFQLWLGLPEGFLVSPYQLGMVRWMLLESCCPDWSYIELFADDLDRRISEDARVLTEKWALSLWVKSCCEYLKWYTEAKVNYDVDIEALLDPPAVVFRPDKKDQLQKFGFLKRKFLHRNSDKDDQENIKKR